MDAYFLDWANLLLRWAHVITGIAWIGASIHFVGLDNSLTPPQDAKDRAKGVGGELWAVHGGGFYHQQKYPVSPALLPERLHWSIWESYSTWLTGFALFAVLYLFKAQSFLIDKTVFDWSPGVAIATALAFFVAFWLIYDGICRVFGERDHGDVIVGALVFAFIVFASWLSCRLFAGRAAFLLVGAMMATTMSANVLMLAGALIRRSFVLRHGALARGKTVPWEWAIVGTLAIALAVIVLRPSQVEAPPASAGPPPAFAQVQAIIAERCQLCHNAVVANMNVRLDSAEAIRAHAQEVHQQAVVQKSMPLNNATQITDAERATIGRWFEAGARP